MRRKESEQLDLLPLYLAVLAAVVTAHSLDAAMGYVQRYLRAPWLARDVARGMNEAVNHARGIGAKTTAGSDGKVS